VCGVRVRLQAATRAVMGVMEEQPRDEGARTLFGKLRPRLSDMQWQRINGNPDSGRPLLPAGASHGAPALPAGNSADSAGGSLLDLFSGRRGGLIIVLSALLKFACTLYCCRGRIGRCRTRLCPSAGGPGLPTKAV
jgi:hypothetical protein